MDQFIRFLGKILALLPHRGLTSVLCRDQTSLAVHSFSKLQAMLELELQIILQTD